MSERNAMLASAFPSVSRLDVVNRDRGGQDVKEEDDSQLSKRHCRSDEYLADECRFNFAIKREQCKARFDTVER